MPLSPDAALTPQTRNDLRDLLSGLQKYVDESTPQGQLLKERDHWVRMWDDIMQEVLKNLESIRNDQRRTRDDLSAAIEKGNTDTDRVIAAIAVSTEQIIAAINQKAKAAQQKAEQWWRIW